MEPFGYALFPHPIGNLRLRNRIVMAAMGTNLSHPQGNVSDRAISYYRERAKGGVGLIVTEACPVSLAGRHRGQSLCIYEDSFIPDLHRLTRAIHEEGGAIAVQLHHAGRLAYPDITGEACPQPLPPFPALLDFRSPKS